MSTLPVLEHPSTHSSREFHILAGTEPFNTDYFYVVPAKRTISDTKWWVIATALVALHSILASCCSKGLIKTHALVIGMETTVLQTYHYNDRCCRCNMQDMKDVGATCRT
jgi:hypothetical protein